MNKKFLRGGVTVYQTPTVELFEVKPERGFADSMIKEEEEF